MPKFNVLFWRKWHRWIGFPAALFLIFVAVTGFLLAFNEFFGADEALREKTRDKVSSIHMSSANLILGATSRVLTNSFMLGPDIPIDKIEMQFKTDTPTLTFYTGKKTGGEDKKLVFNMKTGLLIHEEAYVDKPFLNRLHSGEVFGDGGLVVAMFWALALAILAGSGLLIYYTMRGKRTLTGTKKVFW
jgi:uncharacterized iron-regulated membrane protein